MANKCKFEKTQYQVSYNNGVTWENVVPEQIQKGELIEYDSTDCSGINTIFRWRTLEGQYLCDGTLKYKKEIQDESYDGGTTWYPSYPTVYKAGQYVGIDEEFCNDKFVGHYIYDPSESEQTHYCGNGYYWDGVRCVKRTSQQTYYKYKDPLKVVKCDNTALTSADTKYYSSYFYLISCEIGDCVTSISSNAFSECSALTSITIYAATPPTLESGTLDNTNNCPIYVPCDSILLYKYDSDWSRYVSRIQGIQSCTEPQLQVKFNATYDGGITYSAPCVTSTTLTTATTKPSGYDSTTMITAEIGSCVTSIGQYAFYGCSSLTSIDMPNSVTSIGAYAFLWCRSLTIITIPSGVTSIGMGAFFNCESLTSVTIPHGVTNIGKETFRFCYSLTSCTIGSDVASIGQHAFDHCSGLTSITCLAIEPPYLDMSFDGAFGYTNNCPIYVPSGSVNTYKSASGWSTYASRIQAIQT